MQIVLNDISKSYGGKPVLRHFSCKISQGSVCAVMGPSGSGKTTLLRLILGLEAPDSGEITGVPPEKSAVFQEDRLCPELSLVGNLRMAVPKCSKPELTRLLDALGLVDSADKPAAQLSGGMARRAALARALLCDSNLLTLDEPFSGLDEAARHAAIQAIRTYQKGRTLLLVTHRAEDTELLQADQVLFLRNL